MDMEAYGTGRSKQDAKHLACINVMRKLHKLGNFSNLGLGPVADESNDGNNESLMIELTSMNCDRDVLKELRDYCVRHDMPLPTIEIVQQGATLDAPEFVACCSVASIKRYGKSYKKKDARQRAAIEILAIISKETDLLNPDNQLTERRCKFKTYRELTDAGGDENQSIKLCDRHNYFKSYYPHLREAAFKVLASNKFASPKDKAIAILSALKLTPKITKLDAASMEPFLFIKLNCELDCVFMNLESKIYDQIIKYFCNMLV